MKIKTANIVLKIFVAVWIILMLGALGVILFDNIPFHEEIKLFIQILISLLCGVVLGIYVYKA